MQMQARWGTAAAKGRRGHEMLPLTLYWLEMKKSWATQPDRTSPVSPGPLVLILPASPPWSMSTKLLQSPHSHRRHRIASIRYIYLKLSSRGPWIIKERAGLGLISPPSRCTVNNDDGDDASLYHQLQWETPPRCCHRAPSPSALLLHPEPLALTTSRRATQHASRNASSPHSIRIRPCLAAHSIPLGSRCRSGVRRFVYLSHALKRSSTDSGLHVPQRKTLSCRKRLVADFCCRCNSFEPGRFLLSTCASRLPQTSCPWPSG